MKRRLTLLVILLSSPLAWAAPARAQQTPRIGYVFPAGGQQGTEFEVRVGGQFLDGVANAHISGPGIQVKFVELVKPMTQQKANQLRDTLQALLERTPGGASAFGKSADKSAAKAGSKVAGTVPVPSAQSPKKTGPLTAEERQMIFDIRKTLLKFYTRPPTPAVAETAVLHVTTSADAEPGVRELRLQTPAGLTNPLVFQIGRLPEVARKPIDDEVLSGQRPLRKLGEEGRSAVAEQPLIDVPLPSVVNGQILSGQVDRYRFAARKDQHVVVAVSAQQLVPYIADAVPGWFQATVRLCDAEGKELAYAGNYRFHPDPVLEYDISRDGNYVVEIKDSVFRGREDFIYRMALGELPFVTDIFPLGGKAGEETRVALQGWNLPKDSLTIDATKKNVGIDLLGVGRQSQAINRLPFAVDSLPECMEQEPNDSPEHAQRVTLPIIINGRIDRSGDRDVFCFQGRAGQEVVAEVYARRLDSPLDSVLKLTDSTGRQLAFNDDHEDKACGLVTHHADSWLRAVLPSAGAYYLCLYDAQHQGGPEYAYRLRISPPRPDFELRVVPSSINARAGTAAVITVHALRRDGFNGPIDLELKDAPAGFSLSGARIPAGQAKVRLTLTVPWDPGRAATALHMEGRATIAGGEVRRPAVPADDMMQAYFYRHLVPAQEWMVSIVGRGKGSLPFKIGGPKEVKLPSGGTAELHFVGPHGPMLKLVQLTLSEPPDGLSIQKVAPSEEGLDIVLHADATKLKPGWNGNAVIEASFTRTPDSKNGKFQPAKQRVSLGALPAVSLRVVAK